jgi:hypothetical protein
VYVIPIYPWKGLSTPRGALGLNFLADPGYTPWGGLLRYPEGQIAGVPSGYVLRFTVTRVTEGSAPYVAYGSGPAQAPYDARADRRAEHRMTPYGTVRHRTAP